MTLHLANLTDQDQCRHERTTTIIDEGVERFICVSCYHLSSVRIETPLTLAGVGSEIDTL